MPEQISGSLLTGLACKDQEDQVEEMVGCAAQASLMMEWDSS